MTTTKVLTPLALVALLALTAAPAHAQHRGDGGRSAGRSRGAVASRGGYRGAQSRSSPVYRGGGVVRGGVVRGGFAVRGGGFRGRSFYRPYYSFRPRVSLGFGLWAGYPVAYPYYYDSPYGYDYPSVDPYAYEAAPSYGYPAQPYGSSSQSSGYPASNYPSQQPPAVDMQRGGDQSAPGGISFEITPDTAAVFVDGTYMGTAGEFGASAEPLGLNTGRHRVEVRASGYRTMTFEADVKPGQVIPYQGTLQRN
jgi:hypothetical protein